jgi:hypothetical protein
VSGSDFNGDRIDDLLLRHDDGRITVWLGVSSNVFRTDWTNANDSVSPDWQSVGTGDFNGDGRDDILWRNADGRLTNWLSDANGVFGSNSTNAYHSVPLDWQVAAIGDFNGDGRDDILWRNSDGRLTNWLCTVDGGFQDNVANAYNSVSTDWQIVGVGDFNEDLRDDILWRNADGRITDWLGNASGGFIDNVTNAYNNVGLDWHVAGVADFNGDAHADILWRNDNGRITNWLGTDAGGFTDNAAQAYDLDHPYWYQSIETFGDFNSDGRDDLVWRVDEGSIATWFGEPEGGLSAAPVQSFPVGWHIQPIGSGAGDWDY